MAALPPFLRLYCFDELCPPPPAAEAAGGPAALARRYDVDALLGVGEAEWVAGAGAGSFEETRWVDLQHPAGGDVWSAELLLWQDTRVHGRLQVKVLWTPPAKGDGTWGAE